MATEQRDIDSFFEQEAQFGRTRRSVAVVFLTALAMGAQSLATYYALGADRLEVSNALTVEFAYQFGEPILLWVALTGVLYLLGRVFTSRIRIGRLFKLLGWGFVPMIATGLLGAVGRYIAFSDVAVPDDVQVGVLESEREAYAAMSAEVAGDPVLVGTVVAGSLFVLVSGYLWTVALEYSSNLDRGRAGLVTAVPVVVYVAFTILRVL